jgi:uncharacterized protein YqhQ
MTEEKKDFCFPRLKEDIIHIIKEIITGVANVVLVLFVVLVLPYVLGDFLFGVFNVVQVDGVEVVKWVTGILICMFFAVSLLGFIDLYEHVTKRYWITEKECYGDKK